MRGHCGRVLERRREPQRPALERHGDTTQLHEPVRAAVQGGEVERTASPLETCGSHFIEPKNVLDKDMRDAILKLERRGEETRRRFEQDHRHKTWFQEWDAMAESAQATEATDEEEDASLWSETRS
ncbi:hypothetical protein N658DRAFT_500666 [Parathielavia hyrcaniae]|uniref:Uncharacterized protein n=1 Tax=Parathielavia hyrcaniae TaxID=113614 RepID=A0AAN6PV38_9PEZI|nr:hypothetical protein N658DRAFT_500666 [Parathielavia hyrcaniae]